MQKDLDTHYFYCKEWKTWTPILYTFLSLSVRSGDLGLKKRVVTRKKWTLIISMRTRNKKIVDTHQRCKKQWVSTFFLLSSLAGPGHSYYWNDPDFPEFAAGWLALVGEKEKALDWLERWIDRGSINYPMLAHGDPLLQWLCGEPRFQRLLDRIRPEWERFVPRFQAAD